MADRLIHQTIGIGDTLQSIAFVVWGDPLRWRDLALLNRLRPPYIVQSAAESDRAPGTLIWGDTLRIPAVGQVHSAVTGDDALGQDVQLDRGLLTTTTTGDLSTIAGPGNLSQALRHRIGTPYQSYYPDRSYGCELHSLLGWSNRAALSLFATGFLKIALGRDPRVIDAQAAALADGDRLRVMARVAAVATDTPTDFSAIYLLPRA